jgi:hypothetical protein
MPAATAAYISIQGSTITMGHEGDIDHTFARFDAPDVNVNRRPILSFKVDPTGNVRLKLTLNGTKILEETFTGAAQARQEVIDANVLRADDNELVAVLTDTDDAGAIALSDVWTLYTNVPD